MIEALLNKETKLAVLGLGYVGLPIALAFARKISVIGFDIKAERIKLMQEGIDPSNELEAFEFDDTDITFTHDIEDIKEATFFIVAVPTPVDAHKVPDLSALLAASETLGKVLKKGDYAGYLNNINGYVFELLHTS